MHPELKSTPLTAVLVISDLEFGGAQRQVVELANNADPNLCQIHVCSLSDFTPLGQSIDRATERLKPVLRRFHLDFTVVPRLAMLLRRTKADVVHSFLFDATIASRLAGLLASRVTVVSSERNSNYQLKRSNFLALKVTRGLNHLTIANSTAGAAFNSRLFGQPIDRYRVVHNGVNTSRFKPGDATLVRKELGLSENQPLIGMFASFKPQKNHVLWLRSARQVVERFPEARLLFVGDELYKGMSDSKEFKITIDRVVGECGLRRHCIFLGNRPNVENYYNACTLTVLPSLFEGTPNVLLESMACGIPVVTTDVADNSYIVKHGETGYIVPCNDESILAEQVCKILARPELRNAMSHTARTWICSEFSCRRLADKTVAAYKEAIAIRKFRFSSGAGANAVLRGPEVSRPRDTCLNRTN